MEFFSIGIPYYRMMQIACYLQALEGKEPQRCVLTSHRGTLGVFRHQAAEITAVTVVPYMRADWVPGAMSTYSHGLPYLVLTASLGSQPHYYLHFIAEKTEACLTHLPAKQAGELGFESPLTE